MVESKGEDNKHSHRRGISLSLAGQLAALVMKIGSCRREALESRRWSSDLSG
jgi:hypothetical protein